MNENMFMIYARKLETEVEKMVSGRVNVWYSFNEEKYHITVFTVVNHHEQVDEFLISEVPDKIVDGYSAYLMAKDVVTMFRKRIARTYFSRK